MHYLTPWIRPIWHVSLKLIKEKYLGYILYILCVLFCCFWFSMKIILMWSKWIILAHIPSLPPPPPPDQTNLICFWHMSLKLIKEQYLGYILSIFMCLFVVFDFPWKLPLCGQTDNFGSYPIFAPPPLNQANMICFWQMSSKLIKKKST